MDINQFERLSDSARENTIKISEYANKLGLDVVFDTGIDDIKFGDSEYQVNGFTVNEQIVINPNSDTAQSAILAHEMTHLLEGNNKYQDFVDMIKDDSKYKGIVNEVTEQYKDVTPFVDSEITAKYVEKNMGNEQFIKRLINYDSNIALKLFDNVKSMFSSSEATRVENAWKRAFEEYKSNGYQGGVSLDMNNRDLQISYLLNDNITPSTQEGVYDNNNSEIGLQNNKINGNNKGVVDNIESSYVTVAPYYETGVTDSNYEEVHKAVDETFRNNANEVAKNLGVSIKNVTENVGGFFNEDEGRAVRELSYSFELDGDFKQAQLFASILGDIGYENQKSVVAMRYVNDFDNANVVELAIRFNNSNDIQNALDTLGIQDYTIDTKENVLKILEFDLNKEHIKNTIINLKEKLGGNYVSFEANPTYSELIERNDRRNLYGEWLDERQKLKAQNNNESTSKGSNAEIESLINYANQRISQAIDTGDYGYIPYKKVQSQNATDSGFLNAQNSMPNIDSTGAKLSPQQQEYFKNSKAVDKNGNLEKVYHTTHYYGDLFSEFDSTKSDRGTYRFGNDNVIFFSSDKDVSGTYSGNKYHEVTKSNYNDLTNYYENRSSALPRLEEEYYNIKGEDGMESEVDRLDNEISNYRKGYQYGGYLNLENPYVIEGNGNDWNELMQLQHHEVDVSNYVNAVEEILNNEQLINKYNQMTGNNIEGFYDALLLNKNLSNETKELLTNDPFVMAYITRVLYSHGKEGGRDILLEKVLDDNKKVDKDYLDYLENTGDFSIFGGFENGDFDVTTNDVVKAVLEINKYYKYTLNEQPKYDGIKFADIYDTSGEYKGNGDGISDVYAVFNSNQFKLADNYEPTSTQDIRYSLGEKTNNNVDANNQNETTRLGDELENQELTPEQQVQTKYQENIGVYGAFELGDEPRVDEWY